MSAGGTASSEIAKQQAGKHDFLATFSMQFLMSINLNSNNNYASQCVLAIN